MTETIKGRKREYEQFGRDSWRCKLFGHKFTIQLGKSDLDGNNEVVGCQRCLKRGVV